MGQSGLPFTGGRGVFGRVENGRGVATKVRDDGCAPGAIDQTGTAQKRCEIIDLAMSSRTSLCSVVRNFARLISSFAAISSSVSQNDISNRIEVQPNESNNYQVGFSF